jgi:hypothetical protein
MGIASNLSRSLRQIGIDFGRLSRTLLSLPRYWGDVARYRSCTPQRFPLRLRYLKPMLLDYASQAGAADGHYFFQDLWAARKIFAACPERHFDIGSRIDGFIAHVLSFMPVIVMDIRPLTSDVPGLTFVQADATNLLGISDDSVESLSSLHATEHFGSVVTQTTSIPTPVSRRWPLCSGFCARADGSISLSLSGSNAWNSTPKECLTLGRSRRPFTTLNW